MQKVDDKDIMRIISGLGGNYIAEEIIKRSKDKNIIYMTTDIILDTNCVKELANYIEQLEKENAELKENNLSYKENKVLKDKIEYLENEKYALYQDNISLLKEKYGAESLYYRYIETPPVEVKGYISEDKIRTKIKELEEKCEAIKEIYTGTYALNGNYLEAFSQIVILRELLGDDE